MKPSRVRTEIVKQKPSGVACAVFPDGGGNRWNYVLLNKNGWGFRQGKGFGSRDAAVKAGKDALVGTSRRLS